MSLPGIASLPTTFSQASLQDYVDCRRRFQLRYIQRVAWPALETEPALENERSMQQGAQFHRMLQQHLLGIPAERLSPPAGGDLGRWWEHYLAWSESPTAFDRPPGSACHPEIVISAPLRLARATAPVCRLLAKYDLIVAAPDGRLTIYDWKTARSRPRRAWLLERLQTRLYLYLLARVGGFLRPGSPALAAGESPVLPEQIEMVYWFAEDPGNPERIAYHTDKFQRDEQYLSDLVAEISTAPSPLSQDAFPLTTHQERCQFCTYRSLCNRGAKAGNLDDMEADEQEVPLLMFDFEQVAEIEF